jgi:hypothetical protein
MADLIEELNQRHKKVHNRLSEQFFNSLYDYIDLTVQHPLLQEIIKEQKGQPDNFHSIWPHYQRLYTEVYEFIRDNPLAVVKKKYDRYYYMEDSDLDSMLAKIIWFFNPLTFWSLIKRKRYCYTLDTVHDGLMMSIRTRVSLSSPPIPTQPQLLATAQQPALVAEPQTSYRKHPEAHRTLELNDKSKWQDITIEFTSIFDVKIIYHGKKLKADYIDLGFADGRNKNQENGKRKKSWNTLMEMSANKGILDLGNHNPAEKEIYKKHKQEISKLLQAFFGLPFDPFEQFEEETQSYKTKFKLLPDMGDIMVGMHRELEEEYQDPNELEN